MKKLPAAGCLAILTAIQACSTESERPVEVPEQVEIVSIENRPGQLDAIGQFVAHMRDRDTTGLVAGSQHDQPGANWLTTNFGADFQGYVRAEIGSGSDDIGERYVCFSFGKPGRALKMSMISEGENNKSPESWKLSISPFVDLPINARPIPSDGWQEFCDKGRFF